MKENGFKLVNKTSLDQKPNKFIQLFDFNNVLITVCVLFFIAIGVFFSYAAKDSYRMHTDKEYAQQKHLEAYENMTAREKSSEPMQRGTIVFIILAFAVAIILATRAADSHFFFGVVVLLITLALYFLLVNI